MDAKRTRNTLIKTHAALCGQVKSRAKIPDGLNEDIAQQCSLHRRMVVDCRPRGSVDRRQDGLFGLGFSDWWSCSAKWSRSVFCAAYVVLGHRPSEKNNQRKNGVKG